MALTVIEIDCYTSAVHDALNDLLPQLSISAKQLTEENLREIIHADATHLLMAEEEGQYLGCLTLVVYRISDGVRARIEDIVVQKSARGRGIGKALVRQAIALAGKLGADGVELTAHPSREAANGLYRKLGSARRETNIYRRTLSGTPPAS